MYKTRFTACLLLALVCAVAHLLPGTSTAAPDADDLDVNIEKLKSKYLPAEFAQYNFTLHDAKQLLRQKCKKAGVADPRVYANLEEAAVRLTRCASSIANLTDVLAEIEVARPRGELDAVFQKYCERQPQAERCLHDFNEQLLPCLSAAERAQNEVLLRIVSSLLGFICYKNGDPITLFIAEDGPECIEANKNNIANCMNATFAGYMPRNGPLTANDISELPELVLGPKQCIDLYDFEECVLGYLEQCNVVTPANIIESMFRFVQNETKCQPEIDKVVAEKKKKIARANSGAQGANVADLLSVALAAVGGLTSVQRFMTFGPF